MRSGRWLLLLSTCLVFTHGCRRYPPCNESFSPPPGTASVAELGVAVESTNGWVTFYPAASTSWRSLIDLTLFADFRPGMKIEEAWQKVGSPDLQEESPLGTRWTYHRPKGNVILSYSEQGSLPFAPRVWGISGAPRETSPASTFPPALLPYLPVSPALTQVTVMNNCGFPGASALLQDGKIKEINWLDTTGSKPPASTP
jgi:hypothetical protein